MPLSLGSVGAEVRQLQEFLNKLPQGGSKLLLTDGQFGPRTRARVEAFQRDNGLMVDGIAGPLTIEAILRALKLLGLLPGPGPASLAVRPITREILGMEGTNNLALQVIPAISIIDVPTFRPGVTSNELRFRVAPKTVGRLGIFAARKDQDERAVILLLPEKETPDRVLICITQGFAQASKTVEPLGWSNPLSPELIKFCLLKHVIKRWGAQTLAARKNMALMYIVRARGKELGPFANDGAFVRQSLTEMATLTNGAFSFGHAEAFTFSSGIVDFNPFVRSLSGHLNVRAVYNIDPAHAMGALQPEGAVRKQYLSGQTGGPSAGFEFLPINRWKNEDYFEQSRKAGLFEYLHNHCMPMHMLYLGIQTS